MAVAYDERRTTDECQPGYEILPPEWERLLRVGGGNSSTAPPAIYGEGLTEEFSVTEKARALLVAWI